MSEHDEMYFQLGKNIRGLRKAFGETQDELAMSVNVTKSAISLYERSERVPERDILVRIAQHYRVPISDLLHGNFSKMTNISKIPLNNQKKRTLMIEKMLPIICTQTALENDSFKEAYEIHKRLYNLLITESDTTADPVLIEQCCDLYIAARQEGIMEGAANLLWWLLLVGMMTAIMNPRFSENLEIDNFDNGTLKDFLTAGLLPEYGEDDTVDDFSTKLNIEEFLEENEVDILVSICLLKKTREYAELGDYYLALCYIFNLIGNNRSSETNIAIGIELIRILRLLQNPYIKAFDE